MAVQIDWFSKPLSTWFYSSHASSHNSTSFGFVWTHPYIAPPSHTTAEFGDAKPIGGREGATPSFCARTTTLILSHIFCAMIITLSPPTPLSWLNQEAAKSFFAILYLGTTPLLQDHLLRSGHFGSLCTTSLNRKRIFGQAAAFFSRGSFRISHSLKMGVFTL